MRIHIKYLGSRRFSSLVRIQTYLKTRRGSGTKSWAKLFHICVWREERKRRREEGRKSRQAWMVAPKCICTDLSKIGNPCVGDRLREYPWAQILQAQSEEPRFFPGTLKALCAYHVKTPATSFQRYPLLADASDSSLSPVFSPSPAQHTRAHHEALSATGVKVVLAPNQLVNPHFILPFFFFFPAFFFSAAPMAYGKILDLCHRYDDAGFLKHSGTLPPTFLTTLPIQDPTLFSKAFLSFLCHLVWSGTLTVPSPA